MFIELILQEQGQAWQLFPPALVFFFKLSEHAAFYFYDITSLFLTFYMNILKQKRADVTFVNN